MLTRTTVLPISLAPVVNTVISDAELLGDQGGRVSVFQIQLYHLEPKLEGIRLRCPPLLSFFLWFLSAVGSHE